MSYGDYIIVNDLFEITQNNTIYKPTATINSDHEPCYMEMKLKNKSPAPTKKTNPSKKKSPDNSTNIFKCTKKKLT